jgi:PEP-CTERM motif
MRSVFASAGLAIALVGFASSVDATPITYEFSGTGSGAIGGTSFTNALVVYNGTADTANVETLLFMGFTFYAVALDGLKVNIAGVGTATILDPAEVFDFPQAIIDPDGEIPPLPGLILGRIDNPPDLGGFTGMAALFSNSLAGYDLKTSFGPIGGIGGVGFIEACGTPGHDPCLATSRGALSFTTNIVSEGTFAATVHPVPEPTTLLLMGGGLTALVRRSRRHGRR